VDRSEALQVLRETAAEILAVDPNVVVEDARFQENLEADSLDMIELVMALEDKFVIRVPQGEVKNIITVRQGIDVVLKTLTGA
jgi:acyl carrier protein